MCGVSSCQRLPQPVHIQSACPPWDCPGHCRILSGIPGPAHLIPGARPHPQCDNQPQMSSDIAQRAGAGGGGHSYPRRRSCHLIFNPAAACSLAVTLLSLKFWCPLSPSSPLSLNREGLVFANSVWPNSAWPSQSLVLPGWAVALPLWGPSQPAASPSGEEGTHGLARVAWWAWPHPKPAWVPCRGWLPPVTIAPPPYPFLSLCLTVLFTLTRR